MRTREEILREYKYEGKTRVEKSLNQIAEILVDIRDVLASLTGKEEIK